MTGLPESFSHQPPRKRSLLFLASFVPAFFLFTGCSGIMDSLSVSNVWKGPQGQEEVPQLDPTPAEPAREPALILTALANGPVIQFTLENRSKNSIPIKRDDFALVVPGGRRLVKYDSFTTNLEISPWPEILRPGQRVAGRAIFHEVQDPIGYRLVVNPRSGRREDATFAVVMSPTAKAILQALPEVSSERSRD
jgi:hypothetical protein